MGILLQNRLHTFRRGLYYLFLVLIFTIPATFPAKAQQTQEQIHRNSIFLELAGNGGFYSINYDHILLSADNWRLAGRAGAMYYSTVSGGVKGERTVWLAAPLEVSYLRGRGDHFMELGIGLTPLYQEYPEQDVMMQKKEIVLLPVGRLGYRYQQRKGGMFYKAGFTPMAQFNNERNLGRSKFLPWFGLAVGYTLKK
ncbi:hypothetical protein [Pontibacter vulgaris]|uniref:hypothetical protein n=1 Tax=Pontibacter vulgaris TaxID=2905679 RepID=UPI001FA73CE6|nr:hypothetical protein [Pontibacter vulgaris]